MKGVSLLGATGSIGSSTLSVISAHSEKFHLHLVAAQQNATKLLAICQQFKPTYAWLENASAAAELKQALQERHLTTQVVTDAASLHELVQHQDADIVVAGMSGTSALSPIMAAIKAHKRILLANKEVLVLAGDLFMSAANLTQTEIIPVDSEHNAIFQCLPGKYTKDLATIKRIILTASGGPFLNLPLENFKKISVEQACAHPNWSMGRKISVDSATMVNKGLEVIEASYLFNLPLSQIDVLIHPQSIVHSCVEYVDGSWLSQMAVPDMRIPIAVGLFWPNRHPIETKPLSLTDLARLDFMDVDRRRYPGFMLALAALEAGDSHPAIFNAANEVAVRAFIDGQINFNQISQLIETSLEKIPAVKFESIQQAIEFHNDVVCATKKLQAILHKD